MLGIEDCLQDFADTFNLSGEVQQRDYAFTMLLSVDRGFLDLMESIRDNPKYDKCLRQVPKGAYIALPFRVIRGLPLDVQVTLFIRRGGTSVASITATLTEGRIYGEEEMISIRSVPTLLSALQKNSEDTRIQREARLG